MNNLIGITSNTLYSRQDGRRSKMITVTAISPRWVFALMAAVVICTPLAAWADKVVADADFVSTSIDRCTDNEVNVFVKSGQIGIKAGLKKAKVTLTISQIDECQDRVLLSAEAKNINLKTGEFTVNNGKATLDAVIPMLDRRTGKKFMVDVFVRWVTNSDLVTADVTSDMDAPGQFAKLARKTRKTLHLADASGSITDSTNSFIKGPAEEASLTVTQ